MGVGRPGGRERAVYYYVSGVIGMDGHSHVSRQCLWPRGSYHNFCI